MKKGEIKCKLKKRDITDDERELISAHLKTFSQNTAGARNGIVGGTRSDAEWDSNRLLNQHRKRIDNSGLI